MYFPSFRPEIMQGKNASRKKIGHAKNKKKKKNEIVLHVCEKTK